MLIHIQTDGSRVCLLDAFRTDKLYDIKQSRSSTLQDAAKTCLDEIVTGITTTN